MTGAACYRAVRNSPGAKIIHTRNSLLIYVNSPQTLGRKLPQSAEPPLATSGAGSWVQSTPGSRARLTVLDPDLAILQLVNISQRPLITAELTM